VAIPPLVKNWRILLEQSFTANMPLLVATSAFWLEKKMLHGVTYTNFHHKSSQWLVIFHFAVPISQITRAQLQQVDLW